MKHGHTLWWTPAGGDPVEVRIVDYTDEGPLWEFDGYMTAPEMGQLGRLLAARWAEHCEYELSAIAWAQMQRDAGELSDVNPWDDDV